MALCIAPAPISNGLVSANVVCSFCHRNWLKGAVEVEGFDHVNICLLCLLSVRKHVCITRPASSFMGSWGGHLCVRLAALLSNNGTRRAKVLFNNHWVLDPTQVLPALRMCIDTPLQLFQAIVEVVRLPKPWHHLASKVRLALATKFPIITIELMWPAGAGAGAEFVAKKPMRTQRWLMLATCAPLSETNQNPRQRLAMQICPDIFKLFEKSKSLDVLICHNIFENFKK